MADFFLFFLLFLILALGVICFYFFKKNSLLEKKVNDLLFSNSSQSVKFGKTSEQFMPFMRDLPFEKNNFRFLGSPIDGVAFTENEIFFCEFKTGSSNLSEKQKKIRDLVNNKKVKWLEVRLNDSV